jgi:transposase
MRRIAVFVGLDYHQDGVQVCVMDRAGQVLANRSSPNDWQQIAAQAHRHGGVVEAAIESCTGAADLAEELLQRAGWSVHLAHPGFVSRMKQNPDKHDWGDARLLADLVRVGYLPKVWLAPQEVRELRRLVRYRQQLVDYRRATKLRIRGILRDNRVRCLSAAPWTQAWWSWVRESDKVSEQSRWVIGRQRLWLEVLREEIGAVERRLHQLTREDVVVTKLRQLPGIGPVTAWALRAEIGRFDRFRTGKQLSRFCGLSPRNASSGARQADAGLIKAGNPQLRAVLIQAAHRLMRYDTAWADLADKLLEAGKPKSVVAAAVGNRWMRWLFHQMQPVQKVA